jgi:hypothetical protein
MRSLSFQGLHPLHSRGQNRSRRLAPIMQQFSQNMNRKFDTSPKVPSLLWFSRYQRLKDTGPDAGGVELCGSTSCSILGSLSRAPVSFARR